MAETSSSATVNLSVKFDDQVTAGLAQLKTSVDNAAGSISTGTKKAESDIKTMAETTEVSGEVMAKSFDAIAEHALSIASSVMGFEALKAGLEKCIDKADDMAVSQALLSRATSGHSKELREQADALSTSTRFDEAAIVKGQALMANFVGQTEAIKNLTPLVLDLAQAKGMDLNTAEMMVTRAIGTQATTIRGLTGTLEGTAGTAERLASVMKLLGNTVGGAATEAGNAGAGAWVKFKNSLDKTEESIGNTMIPYMESWVDIIHETTQGWTDLIAIARGAPGNKDNMSTGETQEKNLEDASLRYVAAKKAFDQLNPLAKDPYTVSQRDALTKEIADQKTLVDTYRQSIQGLGKVAEAEKKRNEEWEKRQKLIKAPLDDSPADNAKKEKTNQDQALKDLLEGNEKFNDEYSKDVSKRIAMDNKYLDNFITDIGKERAVSLADLKTQEEINRAIADMQTQEQSKDKQAMSKLTEDYRRKKELYTTDAAYQNEVDKWYVAEKKKLDAEAEKSELELYQARFQAAGTFFAGMSQLMTAMAGKNKGMLEAAQKLAEAEAVMNTAVGVTKAFEQGGVLGFVTGAGVAAAGAAQVITIENQKFAMGGYVKGSIPSGDKTPIWTNPGELVLNPGQQSRLFALANGSAQPTSVNNARTAHVTVNQVFNGSINQLDARQAARSTQKIMRATFDDPNFNSVQAALV